MVVDAVHITCRKNAIKRTRNYKNAPRVFNVHFIPMT
jgi:hypothetical protein